jgi:hypothetical protein
VTWIAEIVEMTRWREDCGTESEQLRQAGIASGSCSWHSFCRKSGRSAGARCYEAVFVSGDRGLGSVVQRKFGQDPNDMGFDGRFGDE